LSLDAELGRHIGSKTEAEAEAAKIRAAILAGTFERAADRLARELRQTACGVRAVERGAKKTGRSRLLPMSARLSATLDMAKTDPAGRPYPPAAYVFGQLGARVREIKKAWETCVLRAHGHEPHWTKGTHGLNEESRAAFRAVNPHCHDLRHEAGCRWLEAGWPIHHVQEMLGHTNFSQTSTYLHAAEMGLQESMQRFDAARVEGPVADVRGNPVVVIPW